MKTFMPAIVGLLALLSLAAFVGGAYATEINRDLPKCPSWYQCRL